MKTFRRLEQTESSNGKHQHVALIDEDSGESRVSFEANHTHVVAWRDAELDPETGAELSPAGWYVEPDPVDGHTHELDEIETKYPKSTETDQEICSEVYTLFKEALEVERESLDMAEESEKFYTGEGQWTEAQRSHLERLGRACLTLNYTEKHVDELVGHYREQRTEWRYLPQEGGDQVTADVFNYLVKYVADQCNYEQKETAVVEDQVIAGRGNFQVYMDFSQDLRGEIKIGNFPYDEVLYGPHHELDASDCEYQVKHKMVSLGKLKQLAPKKWKKVTSCFDALAADLNRPRTVVESPGDKYALSDNRWPVNFGRQIGNTELVDVAKKEYRIVELARKVYVEVSVVGIPEEEFYFAAWGWNAKDLKSAALIPGAGVVKRTVQKMRMTRICGDVVLSDENPADLPTDDFYTIPVYAKKRRGRWWGKPHTVKDAQREVNFRRSQMVDIGNKMIAYCYFADSDTFVDERELEKFKENSTSPGGVYILSNADKPPKQVEGVKFPNELAQMAQIAMSDVAELMNIQVVPGGANDSGSKLLQLQANRLRGNEFISDNLKFAKRRIGRLLPPLLQKYYRTRAYRILLNQNQPNDPVKLGGQPLAEFTEEQITAALSNADATRYDLVVSEVSLSPTQRMLTREMLMEMAQAGNPPPPDLMAEYQDLPDHLKKQWIQSFQQQADQQMQMEGDKQSAEVDKVLVSKGIITPHLAEKYQIPPEMVGLQPQEQQQDPETQGAPVPDLGAGALGA